VTGLRFFRPGETLDLPGRPVVVFSPGHTFGHCALHVPAASALLVGDALVTFNPYTGGSGPQIVSGAATADSAQALLSLSALSDTGAAIVLPGHGPVWRDGIRRASELAFRAGPS
jgi:glyoxylase-like metal-dependent hydrolase (beta-lactamase superfamily II)